MSINLILRKIHILLMPVYDWNNYPLKQQIQSNYQKLREQKSIGALLFLVKVFLLLSLNLIFYIIGILLSAGKYRILCVDLSQLGSVFYLDVRIKELMMVNPKLKFIVPVNPYWDRNNKQLLNLYNPYVVYADSIILKLFLCPFYYNFFLTVNTKNIDGKDSLARVVFSQYREKMDRRPLATLSEEQEEICRKKLSKVGIHENYVVLHVRDAGFYKESWNSMRNADIDSYFEAIQYLVEQNYKVVRIGSSNSKTPSKDILSLRPHFFDYSKSSIKTEVMDIFLLSNAIFFIGMASGPFTIASIFNIPVLVTNHFSPGDSLHLLENDLSIFKKYVHKDGKNINLIHLFSENLRFNPSVETLNEQRLSVLDNSPSEILEAVKEFCERISDPSKPTPLNDQIRSTTKLMIPGAVWRPGKFSESFLQRYIENQSQF